MSQQVSAKTWDPFKTYDLTNEQKRLVQQRQELRSSLKAEWQKKVSNPHRGMHGYIFDPAVTRHLAMRSTYWSQFKATPRTSLHGLMYGIVPLVVFTYAIYRDRKKKETAFRNGEVAYADREWKHV